MTEPLYYQKSLEERLYMAYLLTIHAPESFDPAFMRLILGESVDAAQICSIVDGERTTFHIIANVLAQKAFKGSRKKAPQKDGNEGKGILDIDWRSYLESLLVPKPNIHHIFLENTPFIEFLYRGLIESMIEFPQAFSGPVPSEILHVWLDALCTGGVDLNEYGRTELELYLQNRPFLNGSPPWPKLIKWYFTKFDYGSLPSDWDIHVDFIDKEEEDETPKQVPGA